MHQKYTFIIMGITDMERSLQQIFVEFCAPVLIKQDHIELSEAATFLIGLNDKERLYLLDLSSAESKQKVRAIVRTEIHTYISSYGADDAGEPFSFDSDSGSGLNDYIERFHNEYKKLYNNGEPPKVFEYAFECIKEASESYRLFENFYRRRRDELEHTVKRTIDPELNHARAELFKFAEQAGKNAADVATEQANQTVQKAATKAAEQAKSHAEDAAIKAKEAVALVDVEIQKKMADISTKASETSVTILGMFTCIVLTIVAGLFYSSSVIANIRADNFTELIAAASVVGIVCFDMISIMFLFIEKNREKTSTSSLMQKIIVGVNLFLLAIFIISCLYHFCNTHNDFPSDSGTPISEASQADDV